MYNNIAIEFKNAIGKIELAWLKGFSFTLDLFRFYASSRIVLEDLSRNDSNLITMGLDVDVTFTEDVENGKVYTHKMKVLEVKKNPAVSSLLADEVEISLISSWYFSQAIYSRAYKGSISDIVTQVIRTDFSKLVNLQITPSEDTPQTRYQLNIRSQEFLKGILPFSSYKNLPMYLYTDVDGSVYLKGFSELISKDAQYLASPYIADELNLVSEEDRKTKNLIYFESWTVNNSCLASNSVTTDIFTTSHFVSVNDIKTHISMRNAEYENSVVTEYSPEKANYLPWYITPSDAASISSKEVLEKNLSAFTLEATVANFELDYLKIGNILKVVLPYKEVDTPKGQRPNPGDGEYIITGVYLLWTEGVKKTQVSLSQIRY